MEKLIPEESGNTAGRSAYSGAPPSPSRPPMPSAGLRTPTPPRLSRWVRGPRAQVAGARGLADFGEQGLFRGRERSLPGGMRKGRLDIDRLSGEERPEAGRRPTAVADAKFRRSDAPS